MKVVGLLLAGGQSRRMGGGDKTLRSLGGIPLLERVIERLRPQVNTLVLNANGDPSRFAKFGLPVVADSVPGFAGPLAGGERIVFDSDVRTVDDEHPKFARKASLAEDAA